MTVGDEIADTLIDPDFFKSAVWSMDKSLDITIPITRDDSNRGPNTGTGANWKSPLRKNLRQQRLLEVFLSKYNNVNEYWNNRVGFKKRQEQLEKENCWPAQLAKKINYDVVCGGETAASAGWMFYQLLDNINKNHDLYIMAWTYPTRNTFWNSEPYLRYSPGWQCAHINAPGEQTNFALTQLFNYSFGIHSTVQEYVESIVLSAELLERTGKNWYFTFGEIGHITHAIEFFPSFVDFLKKYEHRILEKDLFVEMYKVTDHLHPKAMLAGHPRLEAHPIIADRIYEKIKDDL